MRPSKKKSYCSGHGIGLLRIAGGWAIALLAVACAEVEQPLQNVQQVRIGNKTFTLELALDEKTRYQGLSDRAEIKDDGGMLFVFRAPRVLKFVMRRCLVPIDLVLLDPSGRIVAMHRMEVGPYDTLEGKLQRYTSTWPAQFAIELKSGTIDQIGIQLDQRITLPVERLKDLAR